MKNILRTIAISVVVSAVISGFFLMHKVGAVDGSLDCNDLIRFVEFACGTMLILTFDSWLN